MHTLKFKTEELTTLAQATADNLGKQFRKPYSGESTDDLGFWLVKDNGIYLMNAFKTEDGSNIVVYADGYNPNERDCWEEAHFVSADDFAEFVPIDDNMIKGVLEGLDLFVGLSETEMHVTARKYVRGSETL